jgi:hypothetical protein
MYSGLTEKYIFYIYQMEQLWRGLYKRDCGEGLTDVKSEGADIEKV